MKTFISQLKLVLITIVVFGILYPIAMVGIGQLMPERSNAFPIYLNDELIGFKNVGQPFYSDHYFWSRPSDVEYNASDTGSNNFGPTNPEFLSLVEERVERLLEAHPDRSFGDIPVELVTASGGGLDPHITREGAVFQAERIAAQRSISLEEVLVLIDEFTERPLLGLFGPPTRVNVLQINIALDERSPMEVQS